MLPNDPAQPPVPAQAVAHGGTFVRPGAVAWGGDAPVGAYSSCEFVEQLLAAAAKDPDRIDDLMDELTRARLWVPLPAGRPVTNGSAVALPTVTYLGAEFVPCFTSVQRLRYWTDPPGIRYRRWRRAGDSPFVPHIVVPAVGLARHLPAGFGMAVNPGDEASVPIYPDDVGRLGAAAAAPPASAGVPAARTADAPTANAGPTVRIGHPPAPPAALLGEVSAGLRSLPAVRHASTAWLSVPSQGEGLVISVTLDDPASEAARDAVLCTIERAVAAVPRQAEFPIDATFPGEYEPDQLDDWVARNTRPFYTRG